MKKLLNDLFNYISWTLYEGKKLSIWKQLGTNNMSKLHIMPQTIGEELES
jgi:hypothetical protein